MSNIYNQSPTLIAATVTIAAEGVRHDRHTIILWNKTTPLDCFNLYACMTFNRKTYVI